MPASMADRWMWVSSPSARRGLGLRTNALLACTVRSYGRPRVQLGHTLDIAMYGLGMTQSTCPFGPGYDFTDPDVLLRGIPVTEFAELRKTAPVWWNEQEESIFDDGGYWVISRHEDIKAISRDTDLWSTNRKGVVMRLRDGTTPDQRELTKALLINHDAREHTRLRTLVSRLFTPRAV